MLSSYENNMLSSYENMLNSNYAACVAFGLDMTSKIILATKREEFLTKK